MGNEAPAGWARRRVLFICIGNSCRSQLAEAFSRHWAADGIEPADRIVNSSGIPDCVASETDKPVVDWDVDDPYGEELAEYRRIAAEIEARVLHLAAEFQPEQGHSPTG